MATFTYKCKECDEYFTFDALAPIHEGYACDLGHWLQRYYGTPAMHVKETIDNGYQTRRVERPADGIDLLRERHENQSKKTPS
jgi:hypothetical protein